jgi:hypothetical protein
MKETTAVMSELLQINSDFFPYNNNNNNNTDKTTKTATGDGGTMSWLEKEGLIRSLLKFWCP